MRKKENKTKTHKKTHNTGEQKVTKMTSKHHCHTIHFESDSCYMQTDLHE